MRTAGGMRELLDRLERALPEMERWMKALHDASAARAVAATSVGSVRLAEHFPEALLASAYAVSVDSIPFPPVTELGLPEFGEMARIPMAGITFGHMYFVAQGQWEECLHFHELVHVVQWRTLGVHDFLRSYSVGLLLDGYAGSPLEMAAYDLQARFQAGVPIPEMIGFIEGHARQQHAATTELYASLGVRRGPSQRNAPDEAAGRVVDDG